MMTTTCLIGVLIAYVFGVFGVLLVPPAQAAVISAAALRHASAMCPPTRRDITRPPRIWVRCAIIPQTLLRCCATFVATAHQCTAASARTTSSRGALLHTHCCRRIPRGAESFL